MPSLNLNVRYYRAYPQSGFLGHKSEQVQIDMTRAAFVLVDVYGLGFSEEDEAPHPIPSLLSWTVEEEREVTVGKIKPALDAARSVSLPIIYLCNSAPRIALGQSEFAKQIKRTSSMVFEEICAEDTVDPREYHFGPSRFLKHSKILEPQASDYYIRKLYYSGFKDTRFDALLRNLGVKTLIFVGYAADVCLHCTMIDALNLDYEVIFLRDCTLSDVETLPGEVKGTYGFTERMVIWTEINVGRSTTSEEFVRACQTVRAGSEKTQLVS
jgi:nicotinamidase-related amidase